MLTNINGQNILKHKWTKHRCSRMTKHKWTNKHGQVSKCPCTTSSATSVVGTISATFTLQKKLSPQPHIFDNPVVFCSGNIIK